MPSREEIAELLRSIERYNPNNIDLFVRYVKDTVSFMLCCVVLCYVVLRCGVVCMLCGVSGV